MTAAERRATAIHEAGHATVMWSLPQCDPVLKVTVVPRGRSLGATWYVPDERRIHVTNEALQERLAGLLGGRIAEEVSYGTLGAGALSDLERATETAYAMVAYYGMSKKIGPISYYDSSGHARYVYQAFQRADGPRHRYGGAPHHRRGVCQGARHHRTEERADQPDGGPAAGEGDDLCRGYRTHTRPGGAGAAGRMTSRKRVSSSPMTMPRPELASAPADAPPAGTGTTQEGDAGSASGTKTAASGAANAENPN